MNVAPDAMGVPMKLIVKKGLSLSFRRLTFLELLPKFPQKPA